jgi:hypothetical protein
VKFRDFCGRRAEVTVVTSRAVKHGGEKASAEEAFDGVG